VCPAIGWLVRWLWRWLGWSWVVVFVQRDDDDVAVLKPLDSLPVSIGLPDSLTAAESCCYK
jgi:hypothetical protein